MELLADCLITFGLGIQVAWLSMPSAVLLIRHGDRHGWIGPIAVTVGLLCICGGVWIYV
jgi:hypothetical protein